MTDSNESILPSSPHDRDRPLAPGARGAALLSGVIRFFVVTAIAVVADLFWLGAKSNWPLPRGGAAIAVAALLAFAGFVYPFLWFRSWRWRLEKSALVTSYGWLWRTEHAVPLDRIQHVDVDSGPIDRAFSIATVTVFTAGSGHASLAIPGLLGPDAHALRDALLGREHDADPPRS